MKLTDQLRDYINAAFTGLWVQTYEPDEAERGIVAQPPSGVMQLRRNTLRVIEVVAGAE